MKKLLALLLVLLLPLCGLAEAYECSIAVDADEASFPIYVKEALMRLTGMPKVNADKLAQVLQAILDDVRLTAVLQEDAASVDVRMAGGPLFDMTARKREEDVLVTSSAIPGYALVADELQAAEYSAQVIGAAMEAALQSWLGGIQPTVTRGIFSGDAFEGGTECTTWVVTDQQIASMISALLTPELRAVLVSLVGTEADQLLGWVDDLNQRVAEEDAYLYILRVVRNESDVVGASLSILSDASQLATVSVGIEKQQIRVVAGLGMQSQNYWWEGTAKVKERNNTFFLSGTSTEWIADKTETFWYVKDHSASVASNYWSCNLSRTGKRWLWDANLYKGDTANLEKRLFSSNGTLNVQETTCDASFSLHGGDTIPLSCQVNIKPADEIPPMESSLTQCAVTDTELYKELQEKLSADVGARLLKLLPIDVMLMITEMFIMQ